MVPGLFSVGARYRGYKQHGFRKSLITCGIFIYILQ